MPRPEDTRGPKGSLGGEEPNPFNPTRWGSTFCAANAAWIIHENMVKTCQDLMNHVNIMMLS